MEFNYCWAHGDYCDISSLLNHDDIETTKRYIGYYECVGDNENDGSNKDRD